ncbi:MAG: dihydrofolate reductase family protein [Sciscionella sp.]
MLHGDVATAVAELRRHSAANLVIMGSSVLIRALMAADLIDQYLLMVAPVVLGTGRRLFAEGSQATLRLCHCSPTSTGALIATYEPARLSWSPAANTRPSPCHLTTIPRPHREHRKPIGPRGRRARRPRRGLRFE